MKINRLLTNIVTANIEKSKQFYITLFSFDVDYDSDWFIHLVSKGSKLELGLIDKNHEIVPEQARSTISGIYLTFVVDDVDALYLAAQSFDYKILQAPEITFYGQKKMLIAAPEGTVCDVSSPA